MKKKLVAIAAAAVAIVPLMGSPAQAGTAGGSVAFECIAVLPAFPSSGGTGTCGSNSIAGGPVVPSSAEGTITGVTDGGQPFELVAAGVNNFSATFNYQEACVAGEPPLVGTASGTATITGLTGVVGTTSVSGGSLKVNFTWTRAGLTAAVTITGADISLGSGVADDVTGTVVGAGAAGFVPVLQLGNVCPTGDPLRAYVGGTASVGVAG